MCGVRVIFILFVFFPADVFYEYAVGSSVEKHHAKPHQSFGPS